MKPFDLEAAKRGDKVVTRDGRKARILCFDVVNRNSYPILVLIKDEEYGIENIHLMNPEGKYYSDGTGHRNDLFMVPKKVKKWRVYKDCNRKDLTTAYSVMGWSVKEIEAEE